MDRFPWPRLKESAGGTEAGMLRFNCMESILFTSTFSLNSLHCRESFSDIAYQLKIRCKLVATRTSIDKRAGSSLVLISNGLEFAAG